MGVKEFNTPDSLEKVAALANQSFGIIFNDAPVMMHATDGNGKVIKVNQKWLDTMGYQEHEVLGHKSVEFLTDQAQVRALKDTLPLFWRVGEARSIGYQFARKDGQILDLLLDAKLIDRPGEDRYTVAALYDAESIVEWEQASAITTVLVQLAQLAYLQNQTKESEVTDKRDPASDSAPLLGEPASPIQQAELLPLLLEAIQNVSTGLLALVTQHEQWLELTEEHQIELLAVAKSIEKSLADLAAEDRE